jgi:mannose-1-phosphate guanylyltransferase/phosphomannomutase
MLGGKSVVTKKPAIFLDRDGTINELNGFISNYNQIRIIPGVATAIKTLKNLGFLIIVVTNQPLIERGIISQAELEEMHRALNSDLNKNGGAVDAFLYCPHEDSSKREINNTIDICRCRKPALGLIEEALRRFQIDLSKSWVIGDSWRDVGLANNVGIKYFQIVEKSKNRNLESNQVYSLEQAAILIESELELNEI